MKNVEIFDPPMCCSTGVCGPNIDPALVRFAADLHWLANQRVAVERYNLAQQPQAFAANEVVKGSLRQHGNECLPLILLDGVVVSMGAGIESYAWVINQSFAGDGFRDPVLVERGSREEAYVAEVRDRLAERFAVVPWKAEAPIGPDRLRELVASSQMRAEALKG